ncbi:ABC transporter substrate-binding protein [Arthrobacter sp. KN11-1C]|uniref:ABC transporter substrate-binding protein n=1 Tax=Arthrobacter sp. KN11-1C TaxID=3445774 RepID=UPI003F9F0A6A
MSKNLLQQDPPLDNRSGGNYLPRRLLLKRGGQLLGVATALGLAETLSGCGSNASADAAAAPDAGITLDQVTNARGTAKIIGWQFYHAPELDTANVKSQWGYIGGNEDTITKTAQPGAIDLVTMTNGYDDQLVAAKRVIPTNPALLSNWANINPTFRNWPEISRNGSVLSIPLQWSYGYMQWDARFTTEPKSLDDLFSPKLARKVGLPDDPYAVITTFARLLGYADPQKLKPNEFQKVVDTLNRFKSQLLTLHQYGEEPALLARGDIWVDLPCYASSFLDARKAGAKMETSLLGSWSYLDCCTVVRGADIPVALSFINNTLETGAQAALASKAWSFPVVDSALYGVPKELQFSSLDAILSKAPLQPGVPFDNNNGFVSFPEWIKAWERFKAL